MRQELERLEEEFSSQPEPEAGTEGLTEIMIELPTGERATRRFGLDEAGSRVHAFVKLHLLRTTVAAAMAAGEGGVPVAPTPESAAAAEAAGTAGAALSSGWSLGINFGPTIPDDATTLRDTGIGRREKLIVKC